jgi:hypothetical protein
VIFEQQQQERGLDKERKSLSHDNDDDGDNKQDGNFSRSKS